MSISKPNYQSTIWFEEAQSDNPFAAQQSFCHGYNVFEQILPKGNWASYLYLLFIGERPTKPQEALLEKVAMALANPGLRDESVRAAMNAGVGGSTAAASLIAALGVGAGQLGGAREIYTLVEQWQKNKLDLSAWQKFLLSPNAEQSQVGIWPTYQHAPGFDPHGESCPLPVVTTLNILNDYVEDGALTWLEKNRAALELSTKCPLSFTGVIAAAFFDLGIQPQQAEMLYLLLRLPGAAVHALEQKEFGWKQFPFFGKNTQLTDDPGPVNSTSNKEIRS